MRAYEFCICLLTNVSELLKTEQMEEEKLSCNGMEEEESKPKSLSADDGKKGKKKKKNDKEIEDTKSEVTKSTNEDSGSEDGDFWMPPVGDRWDFDDGGDRWGSGTDSEQESEEDDELGIFSSHAHLMLLCDGHKLLTRQTIGSNNR